MALTREDVLRLLEILRQDEGLREEFRRLLLPPDLSVWMQKMDRWTERMDEWTQKADKWMADTDEWKRRTDEWEQRTDERLERMEKWMAETDEWKREAREWQQKTEKRLARMDKRLMRIESTLGELLGAAKETEYRQKAPMLFSSLLRHLRDGQHEVAERLREAVRTGKVSLEEALELRRTDLLLLGEVAQGKWEGQTILLVTEISAAVSRADVERAIRRAMIAQRLGFWALPCASGERWSQPAVKRWALKQALLCGEDGVFYPSPEADWDAVEQLLAHWQPL
ncbi:MAG: hypothetical protein SLRJCFUN_001484 [Candidatus Fervidibacter sp.]